MRSAKSVGRVIGFLLFFQLVGLSLPFILTPAISSSGFVESAAGIGTAIRVAVFLLFANGLLTIGIAIHSFPVFLKHSRQMALWFLAFSIIWFVMQAVDNAHILSMLSLSRQYVDEGAAAGANADLYKALGAVLRSTRRYVHYSELLVIDIWFVLFYSFLLRFAFVPRALAAFGLLAVVLHTAGITLSVFVGYSSVMPLGFSLALSHLAIGGWLAAKGFPEMITAQSDVAGFSRTITAQAG